MKNFRQNSNSKKILNLRTFFFEFTFAQKIEQFESITQKIEQ